MAKKAKASATKQLRVRGKKLREPMPARRAGYPATAEELVRNLLSLFSDGRPSILSGPETAQALAQSPISRADKKALWDAEARTLTFAIMDPQSKTASAGVRISFSRELDANDLGIADAFTHVFNGDIATAPEFHIQQELWLSLQQTRFSRAIGRYASFPTDVFVRRLRTFENAGSLRYENKPFSTCLIVTSKKEFVTNNDHLSFVNFSNKIPLARALFDEKWIRALSYGGGVVLVGYSQDTRLIGAVRIDEEIAHRGALLPPHERLTGLCAALVPGTMALVNNNAGDLYALFPDGSVFLKSQGRWHYLNFSVLMNKLTAVLEREVARPIARMIMDLSYDRKGALIVVPNSLSVVSEIVPDHGPEMISNRDLRLFAAKLDIKEGRHKKILQNIAAIDGAVVISRNGKVVDCACMVASPPQNTLELAGLERQTFPGARTTAAWNASVHGLAIKVSEDGPITVFELGQRVFEIG